LANHGVRSLTVAVASLCHKHHVTAIVIGLPEDSEGRETAVAAVARDLGRRLAARGLPVTWVDEALSSSEAEAVLDAHGTSAARKRRARSSGKVDQMAAAIILERYLRSATNEPPER
jgi:putative transcription antitermination factor YqgF